MTAGSISQNDKKKYKAIKIHVHPWEYFGNDIALVRVDLPVGTFRDGIIILPRAVPRPGTVLNLCRF